ncbi:MAG: hypothetical protein ACYC0X_11710 [Pirellulaceae bacterium]
MLVMAMPAMAVDNLLTHGSFDEPGDQGLAEGWRMSADAGDAPTVARMTEADRPGAFVRLSRTSDGQADMRPAAELIPVQQKASYLLIARLRVSNAAPGSHAVELQWFGDERYLGRATAAAEVTDTWVQVAAGPVTPPEGCTRAAVLLRCYAPGNYDFDDLGLWAVQAMPENLVKNAGFESDADGSGTPDDWAPSPEGTTWDTELSATGSHSAKLSRQAEAAQAPAWRQNDVPVEAGRRCELSAALQCDVFGRDFRMTLQWTARGEVIDTHSMSDQTTTGWQRKTLRAIVPPGAERANVVIELLSEGTLWIDDVVLSKEDMVAEVELSILKPNARGLLRQGLDEPMLQAICHLETSLDDVSCRVVLLDAAERELATVEPTADGALELSLRDMPPGPYRLRACVSSTEGLVASDMAFVDIIPSDASGVFFRTDKIAVVHGKPWFPIGLTSISPVADEAERLAGAGFNLLVPNMISTGPRETVQACLDRAQQLGVYVMDWNNAWVYERGESAAETRERALRTMADNVGSHPAFLGLMCDEALWNGVPLSDVMHAYGTMRRLMPTHLFWQNQAPRNTVEDLARYCRAADVSGMDIYPVEGESHSDLDNKTLSVVGDEMDKNHQTVHGRKPVWAILQGFGWNVWEKDPSLHKRAPTWEETRFMAYDAILHGATGIIYWGASYEDRDADIWVSLRRIASELKELTPALVSPDVVDIEAESAEDAVIVTGRRVEGKLWILAVNERDTEVEAKLHLPAGAESFMLWQEEGDRPVVHGGDLIDSFAPHGVHVYREL